MAVVSRATLNAAAIVIRDEVVNNANTATRVGGLMEDESDSYAMNADLTITNTAVALNTAKVSWTKAEEIQLSCSDLTSDITVANTVAYVRMPFAMTLTGVRASLLTAATDALFTVDIKENGSTVLSTLITIDSGEKTSTTAVTPPVISDSSLADDAEITIDVTQIGSTLPGKGLIITLIGTRT